MRRNWMVGGIIVVLFLLVGLILSGNPAGDSTTASSPSRSFQARSMEGFITGLYLNFPEPHLLLEGADGDVVRVDLDSNVIVDPNATLVSEHGRVVRLSHLEEGQRVKVRYTKEGGKPVARYIEILTPREMSASNRVPM